MPSVDAFPPYTKASQFPSPQTPYVPYLDFLRPPTAQAPQHPPRPDLPPPPPGYTRTVHASPAAWPKQLDGSKGDYSRLSTPFGAVPATESKEERGARVQSEKLKCVSERLACNEWKLDEASKGDQPAQWLAAERWRRDVQVPGGLTLLFAHANGLNKETWFPIARRVVANDPQALGAVFGTGEPLSRATNVVINDMWFLDDTHHGVSVDLNAGVLSSRYAWADWGREMLNFATHILPAYSSTNTHQWQLGWHEEGKAPKTPNLVAVGHSYGGNGLVQASVTRPDVFSSLFLIEPMCNAAIMSLNIKADYPIVHAAIKRRSNWPSMKDAAAMRKNPLFATWHDEVFDTWLSHHLVPVDPSNPDGEVTLATPTWAEAAVFSDPNGSIRGWDKLYEITVPAGFLMAGNEDWMGGEKLAQEIAGRAPRTRNERVMKAGHLLPQEAPEEAAKALWRFLTTLAAGDWDKVKSKI